jgi:putative Mg2+ transporter-C (MgtC) family protein
MIDTWQELARFLRLDLLAYLLVAILLGGAIGAEREIQGKPAGLRTNILICVGAALFTQLSLMMSGPFGDPARIAAQIVVGIGFLGAGTIILSRGHVTGLTSAATMWLVAAIGMTIGYGAVLEAVGATFLVLIVLAVLRRVERYFKRKTHVTRLSVEVEPSPERIDQIDRLVVEAGLEVEELTAELRGDVMVVSLEMRGPKPLHDRAKLALLKAAGALRLSDDR